MAGLTTENRGPGTLVRLRPARRGNTYRMVVVCDDVADVVGAAGGWLFDRAMAGCQVNVLLTGRADDRALRILGAQAIDLQSALASEVSSGRPETLVLAANLFRCDARARRRVLETIEDGSTRVMMWGDIRSTEFDGLATPVEHRLSTAARAFKQAALAAAGVCPASAGQVEMFRGVNLRARRPKQSAS
jgi:hypothetical protein